MKKNTKYLLIALACAVVLVGVLLALLFWPKGSSDPMDSIDKGTALTSTVDEAGVHQVSLVLNDKGELDNNSYGTLIKYTPSDIALIDVENSSGSYEIKSYTPITKNDDSTEKSNATVYTLMGFEGLELQSGQVDNVASNVAALDFTSVASVDGANDEDFGFKNPRSTATVTYNDGTKAIIIVGDEAPAGAGTYVKFGSGSPIYLVSDDAVSALLYSVNDLISLTINDSASSNDDSAPESVTLSGTNFPDEIVFVPNTDSSNSAAYVITKPETLFADDNETSLVTGAIRGLYAESVAYANPSDKQISDCGLDKPYAHLVAKYPDTTVDLIASKPDSEGNVLLMKSGGNVIYKKASANLPWVTTSYEDLISTYVLNPSFTAISSMTVNNGKKDYKFTLSTETKKSTNSEGSETTTETTTVKYGSTLLSRDNFNTFFRNVAYTERADTKSSDPSGSPALTVTYTYSDKGDTDTVSYYATDSGKYIATLNGKTLGTVYQNRVKTIINQVEKVAKDETVENIN